MMRNFTHFGRFWMMLGRSFAVPDRRRMFTKELFRQMVEIGVGSLFIVALINVFIGSVTAVQTAWTLDGSWIPAKYIGYIVRDSILLELCPTITCIVLAGKVGSQITSELGSMRLTEQIDALKIMGVNTYNYLILPKILAGIICIPLLICIGGFLSIYAGGLAGDMSGYIKWEDYQEGLYFKYSNLSVYILLAKAYVFSFILTAISCYQGFYLQGGAIDLGRASTRAVVFSNVFILIADYILITLLA